MDKTLTEQEIALLRRKLDLLLRTGQLLVESAADTNRVVRNLNRVAAYLGLPEEKLHIDVSYTMLVVNVSDGLHSFSKFQKCEKHGINMTAISEISKLSWRAIENDYSPDQYEEELERIKNRSGTMCHTLLPSVLALPAEVSASCSVVTGWRFCLLPSALLPVFASVSVVWSSASITI